MLSKKKDKLIVKEVILNILWLLNEKGLNILFQFFIGIKIANYYGNNIYGKYMLGAAFVSFYSVFYEIINERVIKIFFEKEIRSKVVSTVNTTKLLMSLLLILIYMLIGKSLVTDEILYKVILLLSIDSMLINGVLGIEFYFHYKLLSKKIVLINNSVKTVMYLLQLLIIVWHKSIINIILIRVIINLVRFIIIKRSYYNETKEKIKFIIDKKILLSIASQSKYLWITVIPVVLYLQTDKVMIKYYLSTKEVGVYSIAIQLISIVMILIEPLKTSLFPILVKEYEKDYGSYKKKYLYFNTIITWIYIIGIICSFYVLDMFFLKLFSKGYIGAINCYKILAVGLIFRANGALQTINYTIEKTTKYLVIKTFISLILNIILNFIFILKYGMNGAALATTLTHIFTNFLLNFLIKAYRENFKIQIKSFNLLNVNLKK